MIITTKFQKLSYNEHKQLLQNLYEYDYVYMTLAATDDEPDELTVIVDGAVNPMHLS